MPSRDQSVVLQPVAQLDYEKFNALGDRGKMTGIWLEHCQACSAPEIAFVALVQDFNQPPCAERPPGGDPLMEARTPCMHC